VAGDSRYHAILCKQGCWAVCPSDTAVALSALDADIVLVGPTGNKRKIPVNGFYNGLGTALGAAEIVSEIQIKPPVNPNRQTYLKFRLRKAIDFAVVSVATVVGNEEVKIALGGVAPMPLRAARAEKLLSGNKIDAEQARKAASYSVIDAKPLKKNAYKLPIARTLVERALLS
jgi:xanthine dehydrogenase YagS FAD-binding subunit